MSNPAERRDGLKRLEDYLRKSREPKAAVFDIGTRANRLLVGPQVPPEGDWSQDMFFNAGEITNFGKFVSRFDGNVRADNEGLRAVVEFVQQFRELLDRYGVDVADMIATGTAVFRWIKNQDDVLKIIRACTGLELQILSGLNEALCSLSGIAATHNFRRQSDRIAEFSDNDVILLLDQGGGSTEISYWFPAGQHGCKLHSFEKLGTTALKEQFFTTGETGHVDPTTNRRRISTQNQRIRDHIHQVVKNWDGYPELEGRNILPYAMGTAITKCVPGKNYDMHNRKLTIERMLEVSDGKCSEIDTSTQQVRTLYNAVNSLSGYEADRMDGVLAQLYGLPVYVQLLERFGLDHLYVCGYGLRYGVYSWKYVWKQPWVHKEGEVN